MGSINSVTDLKLEDGIAVLSFNSPPVNALSVLVREGLRDGVAAVKADKAARALVIICEGRTFFAGFDIVEFDTGLKQPNLLDVLAEIEFSSKPVVAAIHGTALGGGLELALACHYRVAVPSAKLGLPEVNLGLLPAGGGTQRLPRIVGVETALDMITSGQPIGAEAAHNTTLVDAVVEEGHLRAGAVAFAQRILDQGRPPARIRDRDERLAEARAKPGLFEQFRKASTSRFRGLKAPGHIIRAIEAAVNLPFEQGMKEEERLFYELYSGEQTEALRYSFFAEREAAKMPDLPPGTPTRPIASVGVIGAGTMGGGIAMNFLNVGLPVVIVERSQEALDRGLYVIRRNYETTAAKGRMKPEDVASRMALLKGTVDLASLEDCDLLIEAVFENMDVKKDIFGRLDGIARQGAILATNTSFLDVNEIAAATRRPESVIGLHFFSPANVMRMLEVVRGSKTDRSVVATAMQLARKIGKVAVLTGVCHGFIANRLMEKRSKEADALVLEGAMPWDVDRVLHDYGMPMGQFAMTDLVGLDVIGWSPATTNSATIVEVLNENGRHGQKSGSGYYDYDDKRRASPSAFTESAILDFSAKHGIARRPISDEEILERCLYPVINEGAKVLEEGIALRSSDVDVALQFGYGWPAYRGGPMFEADRIGLPKVLERLKALEVRYGERYRPSPLIERLVVESKRLRSFAASPVPSAPT
jgi:3-hydroxyacyl-CoA dehydrogenase